MSENAKFQAFENSIQLPTRRKATLLPLKTTSENENMLLTIPNKKTINQGVKL
jgi:hypothetical protein